MGHVLGHGLRKENSRFSKETVAEATQIEFSWFLLHKKYLTLVKPELARLQAPYTTPVWRTLLKAELKRLELKCQIKSFRFAFEI